MFPSARERLVNLTTDEIADALLEGFIRYAEEPNHRERKR